MRTQPRVAHVVLSLQPGGLEQIVSQLAHSSLQAGIETHVICLDEKGVLARGLEAAGQQVHVTHRRPGLDPGLIFRLKRQLQGLGVTVVHTHSLDPMFYAGWAAWLAGIRLRVHTQHNTWLKVYGWRDRLKFYLAAPFFHCIVAVSNETRKAVESYGVPPYRTITIPNGVDEAKFCSASGRRQPAQQTEQDDVPAFTIGTVARLSPEKGVNRLIEAFAQVYALHPRAQLVIVGDGPERRKLEMTAASLEIAGRVTFLGYQENVEEILPSLDLFVLPSLTEGIPLALLEAMAGHLPVIATAVGGVPEVVEHGTSGILIPPDDCDAIRQAICTLIDDPSARRALARAAQARIRERFTLSSMSQAYHRIYTADPADSTSERLPRDRVFHRLPRR